MTASDKISTLKTCFISAPAGARLDVLRASLESRGVRLLVPRDLTVGADWTFEIHKELSRADLVIGVLTSDRQSQAVFFELGQASALGRRILILAPPKAGPLPIPVAPIPRPSGRTGQSGSHRFRSGPVAVGTQSTRNRPCSPRAYDGCPWDQSRRFDSCA